MCGQDITCLYLSFQFAVGYLYSWIIIYTTLWQFLKSDNTGVALPSHIPEVYATGTEQYTFFHKKEVYKKMRHKWWKSYENLKKLTRLNFQT